MDLLLILCQKDVERVKAKIKTGEDIDAHEILRPVLFIGTPGRAPPAPPTTTWPGPSGNYPETAGDGGDVATESRSGPSHRLRNPFGNVDDV